MADAAFKPLDPVVEALESAVPDDAIESPSERAAVEQARTELARTGVSLSSEQVSALLRAARTK
jgi:hypothetical protein